MVSQESKTASRVNTTFQVADALLSMALSHPDVIYRKPSARPIDIVTRNVAVTAPVRVPERRPPPKQLKFEKLPEQVQKTVENRDVSCKKKPTSTFGNGSSRPFVPWCKK